ncbi:Microtubule-associated protein, microtubule dynamics during spindle orientation, partial [Nowakowskiella sp. JEL0078]
MFIELDVSGDAVIEELIPTIQHKNPKVVATVIAAITEAVRQFGTKIVGPKMIAKQLAKIFDHKDNNVRTE